MSENGTSLSQAPSVSMAVQPHVLLGGLVVVCLAAHGLVLPWPAFELVQTFVGVLVVALAGMLIAYAARSFKGASVPFRPLDADAPLLTDGPYRFSRNPVYLGMTGVLAGLAIVFSSYLFLGAAIAFVAIMHFVFVLPAESSLESRYGEAFRRQKNRVHRWL
jgi:protein-S-isoprenylcysteine O-methyltransferase Ste14